MCPEDTYLSQQHIKGFLKLSDRSPQDFYRTVHNHMNKTLPLIDAVSIKLAQHKAPLIRSFDISIIIHQLYETKKVGDIPLRIKLKTAGEGKSHEVIAGLIRRGLIKHPVNFPHRGVYEFPNKTNSAEEIICFMDPLCYLSHLSAMEIHGLTNRMAKTIFVTTPTSNIWRSTIDGMRSSYICNTLTSTEHNIPESFPFAWHTLKGSIKRKPLHYLKSKTWAKNNIVQLDDVRVSNIGRTFLDMIRNPDLCGGIHHVLDAYEEHGKRYKNQILKEANAHANKLDKSRIGYIFEELLEIKENQTINEWASSAVQRGGSRKLDSQGDYSSTYSERWCLSLNI